MVGRLIHGGGGRRYRGRLVVVEVIAVAVAGHAAFVVMASCRLLSFFSREIRRLGFGGSQHRGLLTALRDGSIILTATVSTDGQIGNNWLLLNAP